MLNLNDKTIVVTGAGSGIGRAVAVMASKNGASIILVDKNGEGLQETLHLMEGQNHPFFSIDTTDLLSVDSMIRSIGENKIRISGLVHCAGIEKTLPLKSSPPEVFQQIFDINVFAGFELARQFTQKSLADTEGSSIVFISSVRGRLGAPFNVAYCASKSALLAGAKAIALEMASRKIRCNCVLPGFVDTPLTRSVLNSVPVEAKERIIKDHPLGIGIPEDVASMVVFLLSDAARWITGSEFIIDGGYSAH